MKELLKKIAEVKNEIGKIAKNSENPFFKSKYFDINALLEHVEPLLHKNKLMILQPITKGCVKSILFDIETGDRVESEINLPEISDPQKLGSAITYYRRYTLQSLLALQAEDDDANTATQAVKSNDLRPDGKPKTWLNIKDIDKVVLSAKEKGYELKDLYKFYKISKDVKEILETKL